MFLCMFVMNFLPLRWKWDKYNTVLFCTAAIYGSAGLMGGALGAEGAYQSEHDEVAFLLKYRKV